MKKLNITFWILFLIINIALPVSAQASVEAVKDFLPKFSGINFSNVLLFGVIAVITLVLLGVGTYFLVRHLKFNKKIVILEDVQGSDDLEPVGHDKAMLVKIGKGGTVLLYLRKRKVYRGAYGKRMGKNTYYFAIDRAGYWHNVTLGSLDVGMNKIGIKPTSVNMRYQNESLIDVIDKRYNEKGIWEQYGQLIANMTFFMLIALMFYLYFKEFTGSASALIQASEVMKETAQALKEAVGGLDAIRGTGGFIPAT